MYPFVLGFILAILIGYSGFAGYPFIYSVAAGALVLTGFRLISRLIRNKDHLLKANTGNRESSLSTTKSSTGIKGMSIVVLLYGAMAILAALFYGLGRLVAVLL